MENKEIIVFPGVAEIAGYLVDLIGKTILTAGENNPVNVALPGGSTPERIFKHMAAYHTNSTIWKRINFFFGDERCVPPGHPESNFRMVQNSLFKIPDISNKQIFRIQGENDPFDEAQRYRRIIANSIKTEAKWPSFDLIMLGLGEDGHTASIFPGDDLSLQSDEFCVTVSHPQSGQKRITFTLGLINHAKNVVFIVTGQNKALIIRDILYNPSVTAYPASMVAPPKGSLKWLLDTSASGLPDLNE
jgi:6-phosphogluconolactonase